MTAAIDKRRTMSGQVVDDEECLCSSESGESSKATGREKMEPLAFQL